MTYVAPRSCTVVDEGETTRDSEERTAPLSKYADVAAYVLIAEPGAGKTTAFKSEAANHGGVYVTVRNFLTFDDKPEWHDATLFLDGLDESRAGAQDGRTPLNDVRTKLDRLGCPAFRLSCRWADWMAATDKEALRDVSSDGTVTVLRLEPLSNQNVKDILANNHDVEDPDSFIKAARRRGVDSLLDNPQNLDLLATAVSHGKWPDSRKETFDLACRILVREPNGEHLVANPSSTETGLLIEAAGRLSAAQLISGIAGYSLPDRAEPDGDFPSFTDVDGGIADDPARNVLGTRVFVGVSEGKLSPSHRQIAEFLAAKYVSGLLDAGLPLERILALITGFDAELVPSFTNFASWLAVHSKQSRTRLSQLDPSGLIYAGDRQTYSADEKRNIVLNLRRESDWNPWCTRSLSMTRGIGGIVSPELEETFREILTGDERGRKHQSYVMLLMQMLADGEPLPELSNAVEQIVRDSTWNMGVRCAAIDVLTSYHTKGRIGSAGLKRIVADIDNSSLDDPQDELLGISLTALYPRVLSITEVLRYFRKPKLVDRTGEYADFWTKHVPEKSTLEQVAELLDEIVERFAEYRQFMVGEVGLYTWLGRLPVELLNRVLRETRPRDPGRSIAAERLYEWLGMFSDPGLRLTERDKVFVKFDLEWNADTLKALIAHGVETCLRRGEQWLGLVDRRLFGARPFEYAQWCLEMALAAEDRRAASFYVRELVDCLADGIRVGRMTVEGARAGLAEDTTLLNLFDEMADGGADSKNLSTLKAEPEPPGDTKQQSAWQARIAAQASALRAGRGSPKLLADAAETYLGLHEDFTASTPGDRLRNLVGDRSDLVELLLAGLEGTLHRDDLPNCDEVIRLFDQQRIDWLVLSFAAGMHSLEQAGRLSVGDLNQSQVRMAVTILYTLPRRCVAPTHAGETGLYRPEWFRALLCDEPALVADVVRRTALRKLETGVQQTIELHELANAEDHRGIAELISLSVLEGFPKAETDVALQGLCWSLNASLKRCDWQTLGRVIENRLGRGGQGAGEHGCWLASGYLMTPKLYREDFRALADDDDGLKALAMFVGAGRFPREFAQHLDGNDIVTLVAALGAALRRHGLPKRAYWSMADLIDTLGDDPSAAATEAIDELSRKTNAEPFEPAIADARERQARKRREHEYQHRDIGKVVQTLDRGPPANAADLAALVSQELTDLSLKIRDGSTSDWRQYWNVDQYNRPTDPKPEDACRDALLSDLQERIGRLGIDAQPEGVYAEDKRADIRVSYEGFNVPVEIKRSCHGDLWTAVKSQLIAKYTRDPGAAGYGIYLVFWFGDTEKCRPTTCGGWTPETAADVKTKIEESLNDQEGRLISVCVVDVSKPN